MLAACSSALACALIPATALAHSEHDDGGSDDPGITLADKVDALNTVVTLEAIKATAPKAVRGDCVATVDVPLQGDSCLLPNGMWAVELEDGSTVPTHGPDVFDASTPSIDLEAGAATRLDAANDMAGNPTDSAFVTCETNPRVPRTVAVFAQPPGITYSAGETSAITERIRRELRKASEFVAWQAETRDMQGGANAVRFRMDCTPSGLIDVRVVQIADPERDGSGDPTFSGIDAAVRATGVLPGDNAGRIVAYVPFDLAGVAGQGWQYQDARPVRDNAANGDDLFAAHYLTGSDPRSPDGIEWDVFLHEMMHNMGAVNSGGSVPDSNGQGHCSSDADIMCYAEGGVSTTPVCAKTQLDCNGNTYFNASNSVGGWLGSNWNAGATHNRFLDFGARTAADIVAPTRPVIATADSPASGKLRVTWTASSDPGGSVQKYVVYTGVGTPQTMNTLTGTAITISGFSNGTRQAWVVAYDTSGNISTMSLPATVHVGGVVSPPTDGGGSTGGGGGGGGGTPDEDRDPRGRIPAAPTGLRVTSLSPGYANLAWQPSSDASADTQYYVQVLTEGSGQWEAVTEWLDAPSARIPVAPGSRTLVAVSAADDDSGESSSSVVPVSTPARGSKCTWAATDTKAPTPPKKAKVTKRTKPAAMVAMRPASDSSGVCALRLYTKQGAVWKRLPAVAGNAKSLKFAGLKKGAAQLAIEAIDARGNISKRIVLRTR